MKTPGRHLLAAAMAAAVRAYNATIPGIVQSKANADLIDGVHPTAGAGFRRQRDPHRRLRGGLSDRTYSHA